jgi:rare lipoprotein A
VGCCLVLVVVVAMLAACGTTPPPSRSSGSARPAKKQGAKTAATPPAPPRRSAGVSNSGGSGSSNNNNSGYSSGSYSGGGGYYKDDGPGSNPPPDLEFIPDATPRVEAIRPGFNRPYSVFGQQYVPRTRVEPFRQRGVASWYGRRFHGLPTSSGELYDMYAMTAAHPTLPIPSYVRVTALSSGRSVVVRVNDRGPFLHGRIIDLSYAAASKLGYAGKGSTEVEVSQIVPGFETGSTAIAQAAPPPTPVPQVAPEPQYRVIPMIEMPAVPEQRAGVEQRHDADQAAGMVPTPVEQGAPARDSLSILLTSAPVAENTQAPETTNETPNVTNESIAVTRNRQNLFLQLGVFTSRDNAEDFRKRVIVRVVELADRIQLSDEGGYFRLYAGPYPSPGDARAAAGYIGELMGIQPFTVRR